MKNHWGRTQHSRTESSGAQKNRTQHNATEQNYSRIKQNNMEQNITIWSTQEQKARNGEEKNKAEQGLVSIWLLLLCIVATMYVANDGSIDAVWKPTPEQYRAEQNHVVWSRT